MSGIDEWIKRNPMVMRLGIMFLPTIIRGDLASLGLYAPIVLGKILQHLVQKIKRRRKEKSVWKLGSAVGMVVGFVCLCAYNSIELKPLANFFLSSFISPMIKWNFPKHGAQIVQGLLIFGLTAAWLFQGIDTIFVGFLFLQAIPEVQRRLWFRPTAEKIFITTVVIISLPFASIGICAWWFPSFLEYFPVPFLRVLCYISNAAPALTDYYDILGLPHNSSDKSVRKAFRDAALNLHPDQVGHDPILLERYHKLSEAMETLTKPELKAAYDEALLNQELHALIPRCVHYLVTMLYWVVHLIIDHHELDNYREEFENSFRRVILAGQLRINEEQIGCTQALLEEYASNPENKMPFIRDRRCRGKESVEKVRKVLTKAGIELTPLPEDVDDHKWRVFMGNKGQSKHGPLIAFRKVGDQRNAKIAMKDKRTIKRRIKMFNAQNKKSCSIM